MESLTKIIDDVKKELDHSVTVNDNLKNNQWNTAEFWDTVKRLHLQNMCINEAENRGKGIENSRRILSNIWERDVHHYKIPTECQVDNMMKETTHGIA